TGDLLTRIRTNPAVKDRIRIFDNLGDAELAWLYRNCLFTVFPSLYEGWGLPVVESLALGKPCICSTAPAVVEASQGMATALDPLDLPAWVAAVERLWLDPEARDLATRRLREFHAQTWREHGESLVAIARKMGV
ncbi:MAG TPA: glycosyltransferase, partial [Isosphaeraceae bacterium]|nr:glycosyltransferase [Isosphaeraceae bacterium]